MNKRKLPVCVLLAAALAVQTSCEINGGIIGYLMDLNSGQEEEEIPEVPVRKKRVEAKLSADKEWSLGNAPDFTVSNAVELISAAYWVNHISNGNHSVTITLNEDIDLSDYLWEPIGAPDGNKFHGEIDGAGHTISGLSIPGGYRDAGFVGCASSLDIHDITFTEAEVTGDSVTETVYWDPEVSGTSNTGIVCGELYGEHTWRNINVQGAIMTEAEADYGAIGGRTPNIEFDNCYADVTVNGDEFNYLNWQECEDDQKLHENDYTVEFSEGYMIRSSKENEAEKLRWVVSRNGNRLYKRNCENETSFVPHESGNARYGTGVYIVYLEGFFGKGYVRCSNTVDFEFLWNSWFDYEDKDNYSELPYDPYEIRRDPEELSSLSSCDEATLPEGISDLEWVYVVNGKEALRKPFTAGECVKYTELEEEVRNNGTTIDTEFLFVVGKMDDGTELRVSNMYELGYPWMP